MPLFDRIIDGLFSKDLARLRGYVAFADQIRLRSLLLHWPYCQSGSPSSSILCKNASFNSTPNPGFSPSTTCPC